MSHAHSNKSGVLDAYLVSVKMDIDDDDEDIVIATICVANEGATPVGNLDVAIITDKGVKHTSEEGITSLGPGVERNWNFEFQQSSGEWTFSLKSGEGDLNIGPFDCEFEYQAPKGRKLGNAIGSSLFSGAFDSDLGSFGQVQERELIDSSQVVLTSYVAENMEGGGTKILTGIDQDPEQEDVLPSPPVEVETPLSLLSPLNTPPSPAKGMPSGLPPTPPKGKPTGLAPTPPTDSAPSLLTDSAPSPLTDSAPSPLTDSAPSPPSGSPPSPPSGPPPSSPPGPPPSSPPGPPPISPSGPPPISPSGPPPISPSGPPPISPSGPLPISPSGPPPSSLPGPPPSSLPGPPTGNSEKKILNSESHSDEDNLGSDNKFVVWFRSQALFISAGLILLFILLNLMLSVFTSGSEKLSIPGSVGEERFAGWTDLILIIACGALFGWAICDLRFGKDLSNKIFSFKDRGMTNFYVILGTLGVLFLFIILNLKFALFSGGSEKISLPGSSGPAEFVGWLDLILLVGLSANLTFIGRNIKFIESDVVTEDV